MITHPIYSYSLCIALPLMLFFGFYFILFLPRCRTKQSLAIIFVRVG